MSDASTSRLTLGIDIGTSAVKAVLIDGANHVCAQAEAPLVTRRPRPTWSEQAPEDWWSATIAAVTRLPVDLRHNVAAVGLAGQMHGAVTLDAAHQPLRPCILWNDGRATVECAELEANEPRSQAITGNIAMPGFTAPKLLWMARHEPALFDRVAHVVLPKDYVRLRLTGELASDMSDSAGTLWLDTGARRWSDAMLTATGLDISQMPRLVEGTEPTGIVTPAAAAALGIGAVPVVGGAGDNAAGAIGMGLTEPGQGFLSLGTSGVIFAVSDGFAPNPAQAVHTFCHAVPDRWHQMAVMLSAASCLEWGARLVGYASIDEALVAAEACTEGEIPLFLPYLSGERTPYNDPAARGVLFGLTHATTRGAIIRGILEGVALGLADGADALRAAGTPFEALALIGGGSRSSFWSELIASALGCRLELRIDAAVGPALGAARLARVAIGDDPALAFAPPLLIDVIEADPASRDRFAERRADFASLYANLRPSFSPTGASKS